MAVSNEGTVKVKTVKYGDKHKELKGSPFATINNPTLNKAKQILAVLTSI